MRIARVHDGWLAWDEQGPTESDAPGEPVVMIMGLAASSRMWFRLLPWIARRHRAIVFDHRGTGGSSAVRGRLSMRGFAHDVRTVMDDAGIDSAHVVGASMGGMVAQHFALEHRESVRSLTLACTTAGGRVGMPPWRLMATAALRPVLGPKRTFPIVAPALFARKTLSTKPERVKEDMALRMAEDTSPLTLYAHMGAIARHDTRARLHELKGLPTLVVHGLEDGLIPADRGRELAALIPGSELMLVPHCSHLLTTDAEHEVAGAIVAHLAGSADIGGDARSAALGTLGGGGAA